MKFIFAALLMLATGCAGAETLAECQARMKATSFDALGKKIAEPTQPSLEQLADRSTPTDEEQFALIAFDKLRIECANAWVQENADLPDDAVSAFSRSIREEQLARADLYLGKSTFGEYNRAAVRIYGALSAEFDRVGQRELAQRQPDRSAAIVRGASAGARQALPVYNPFPKPLICTSTRRGTLVDTYCR